MLKKAIVFFFIFSFRIISEAQTCLGIQTAPNTTVCAGQCTHLNAAIQAGNQTGTYSVQALSYSPFPYSGTSILVNQDDIWSSAINIGFNFCFYGTSFNNLVIGANGEISFNTLQGGSYENWSVTAHLPNLIDHSGNTICAAYRDIDPALGGNVYYQSIGTAPCRTFIVSWVNIPLYDNTPGDTLCIGTPLSTFQVALYESSNLIDIFIQNSYSCNQWNGGYGIIGIQDALGTTAICPPNRNYPATWTAVNEAWRFYPTGASNPYTINWQGPSGAIATTASASVCPTTTSTYTATLAVTNCDGTIHNYSNEMTVFVNSVTTSTASITASSTNLCSGSSATLTASGGSSYNWWPATGLSTDTGAVVVASPGVTTTYTVTGSNGACSGSAISTLSVSSAPVITASLDTICVGNSSLLSASGASSYSWSPANGLSATTGATVTASPTVSTTYSVTGNVNGCILQSSVYIEVIQTGTTAISLLSKPVSCYGFCNGTVHLNGASPGATYTWSPGGATTYSVGNLCAGTYTVQIQNKYCALSTISKTVTVHTPTAALTESVTYTNSTCSSGNGIIHVSGTGGAVPYYYSLNGTLYYTSPNFTLLGPGSYTVYLQDYNHCTDSTAISLSQTTANNPTVTVNSASVCAGTAANLLASGASSYTWSTGAIGSSINPTPTSTSTYTVTGMNAASCKGTATATVYVNAAPVLSVNSASVCEGSSATLSASGANSYTWSTGSNTSSINITPTTSTVYTVAGTNTVTGCVKSISSSVTVNSMPVLSLNNPSICSGNSATLTVSGASTYTWNTGTTGSSLIVSPSITSIYTVSGTNANGCTAINTGTVIVNTTPITSANNATVCVGNSATLLATGAGSYIWSTGATGNSITLSPNASTQYTVTGINSGNCKSAYVSTIFVNPLPGITANSTQICAGNSATLIASGAQSYTWNTGTSGNSITINPVLSTNYTVSGSNSFGCINSATASVSVYNLPQITVNSDTLCPGDSVFLSVSGALNYVWKPANGLSAVTGSVVLSKPQTTEVYTVTGTDQHTCQNSAISAVTVLNTNDPFCTLGHSVVVTVHNAFSPNGDGLNESFVIDGIENYPENHVYIYNRWGQLLWDTPHYNNQTNAWGGKLQNGTTVYPGTYFYIIEIPGQRNLKGWVELTK